jgi:anhydro-N-acetylmuramic acid kinase
MLVVGLMSGTSADAIDVALVNITETATDDVESPTIHIDLIKHMTIAYDPGLQAELFACFRPETSSVDRLSRLNVALGKAYGSAVMDVIAAAGMTPDQIDLVGSHGQTMWYDPPMVTEHGRVSGNTLALGEPAIIAQHTGITTISGFRSRDLAAGGFGAPLVGYMDWLLLRHETQTRAMLNIGGIANVSIVPPRTGEHRNDPPLAFDTGPGNMIIDYCANRATNGAQQYDRAGLIAAQGKLDQTLLDHLLAHPYLQQQPPKTTGRELFGVQFGQQIWEQGIGAGLSVTDIVRTVTAFTAHSIARALREYSVSPVEALYVAGGGTANPVLMEMLTESVAPAVVASSDVLGILAAAKESMLFALLAYQTWLDRPGMLPALTRASQPVILGNITPGRRRR